MAKSKKVKSAAKKKAAKTAQATKKPTPPNKGARGYKAHIAGSRKEAVHKIFDQKGREAGIEKGLELGLKESTLKTWCTTWRHDVPNKGKNITKAEGKKAA